MTTDPQVPDEMAPTAATTPADAGCASSCMYCKATLTAQTRKAHVWPASLGGRLWTRDTNCDTCNNALGVLEGRLHEKLSRTYATVGAVNDERDVFRVTIQFEGRNFSLSGGNALLEPGRQRFDRATRAMITPLPAGFDRQVEVLAKSMWTQGLGPTDAETLTLEDGDPEPALPVGPTEHDHFLQLGSVDDNRVFSKIGLELLAFHRLDLAMRGELSEMRRFVRHGAGTFRIKADAHSTGSGLLPREGLPEVYNSVEVWSCQRAAFLRLVFLGPLVLTGTLTTEWTGDPFRAAYAFDARNPALLIASAFEDGDGPNLAVWFDGVRQESIEQAVARLTEISARLAYSAPPVTREAPPDIDRLRAAVKARLAMMPPKRKKAKPAKPTE